MQASRQVPITRQVKTQRLLNVQTGVVFSACRRRDESVAPRTGKHPTGKQTGSTNRFHIGLLSSAAFTR